MAELFQRVCSIQIDTLKVDGLRIAFSVKKTLTADPNTLDAKIYNLSEKTRSLIKKTHAKVILVAGYPGETAIVFSGDARTIDHTHDGPDWITHVRCGDGEIAYRFARFSEAFAPGTSIKDVIRRAVKALGLNPGNLEDVFATAAFRGGLSEFAHGYTAHGKASAELNKLFRSAGLTWSIQNGALQVLQGNAPVNGGAILLNAKTGMIGSPDHGTPERPGKPSVLKIKSFLRPAARCGGVLNVDAISVKGQFRINTLEHSGDTAAGDWYTSFEAVPYA